MEKKVIVLKQSVPFMTDTQLTISGTSIQFVPAGGGNAIELSELATKQLQSQLNTLFPDKEVERLRAALTDILDYCQTDSINHKVIRQAAEKALNLKHPQ